MTIDKSIRWSIPVILISLIIGIFFLNKQKQKPSTELQLSTFKTEQGWGYSIFIGEKLFIKQEYIPVIRGKHPFPDEELARKTGELVEKKMLEGKKPILTAEDLLSIGVIKEEDIP